MQDTQGLLNGSMNAMMMVAFAVPGGQAIGAGLAVLTAIMNATWPDPGGQSHPVTEKELDDSIQKMAAEVGLQIYNGEIDKIVSKGASFYTDFQNQCLTVKRLLADPGALGLPTDPAVAKVNDFFNPGPITGLLVTLRTARNAMELSSAVDPKGEHRTHTVSLYCFVSMFICAYLKVAVNWEWGYMLGVNAQYDAYENDVAYWKRNPSYQTQHPFADLLKKYPALDPTKTLQRGPTWKDYSNTPGGTVRQLFDEVDHMIEYATADKSKGDADNGLYTSIHKNWDSMDSSVASFDLVLSAGKTPTTTQVTTHVSNGMARIQKWDQWMTESMFRGDGWEISEDDVNALKSAIDVWRATAAQVRFQTYAVSKKDTFATVANTFYHDATFATKIFEMNQEMFPNDKAPNDASLSQGMILKIYSRADIQTIEAAKGA